jgi:hypothetical protein
MLKLELTQQEANAVLNFCDTAVRTHGLQVARMAVAIDEKLAAAHKAAQAEQQERVLREAFAKFEAEKATE